MFLRCVGKSHAKSKCQGPFGSFFVSSRTEYALFKNHANRNRQFGEIKHLTARIARKNQGKMACQAKSTAW